MDKDVPLCIAKHSAVFGPRYTHIHTYIYTYTHLHIGPQYINNTVNYQNIRGGL